MFCILMVSFSCRLNILHRSLLWGHRWWDVRLLVLYNKNLQVFALCVIVHHCK